MLNHSFAAQAAVDDYGDYVDILRRRGFDVRRHPQMKAANDMWGRLLSAGHKSMRRQHNPRAQKFDWTGNRWRQWYDAEPDFHGPNDGYTYDAHRERSGHAGHRAEYADMAADEDLDAHYWPTKSHYEVLGVSPDAADAAIKKAYFAKARECHPDKNRDDPDATAKFERIALSLKRREGGAQTVSRGASPKSRASFSAVQPRSPGTSGQSTSTTGSPARSRASAPARSVVQDVRGMATSRGAAADQGGGGSAGGPRGSTKGRGS